MQKHDIIIIGGGASGMMSAIVAANNAPNADIVLLERNSRVGKKLLTTGNGRCNITNKQINISRFHSQDIDIVNDIISNYDINYVERFFMSLGVPFVLEGDKLFPYSLQAASVLDVLRYECERLGVDIVCDCKVNAITQNLTIKTDACDYSASAVIVACGGNAAPKSGSDGNGVKLLKAVGHNSTAISPAIVPLRTELAHIKPLKGVKVDGLVTLGYDNNMVSHRDEVLFTEYGVSGPAVMQLSRFASTCDRKDLYLMVDFLPNMSIEQIIEYLNSRKAVAYGGSADNLTLGLLNKRVGQAIIKYCGLNINDNCADYSNDTIIRIANAIKHFKVNVTGVCGFDSAQTTAGGIKLSEFNAKTLESKLVNGLFACGEVLDCDGDCGGFNLHWAWSSGTVAGLNAARRINKC